MLIELTSERSESVEPRYEHDGDELGEEQHIHKVPTHDKQAINSLYSYSQDGSDTTEDDSS